MTALDPSLQTGQPIAFSVKVDGTAADVDRIVSIETWSEANRIPRARIVLADVPDAEGEILPLSRAATWLPGGKVAISAGYGATEAAIHAGIIVRHSLRLLPGLPPQLVVEIADPLIAMTLKRSSVASAAKSDRALVSALVSDAGGTVGTNEASATQHETLVQYHASDWDLMLVRAEASACLVLVEDSKVSVVAPASASANPVVEIDYESSIISLEASLDAVAPLAQAAVKSRSWSYTDQAVGEGGASGSPVPAPGDIGAADLARVLAVSPSLQQTAAYLDKEALAGWSSAALMRSTLAAVQGSAQFQGAAVVKPGTFLSLKGVGPRFEGNAFVSAVRHVIEGGAWQTHVTLGMAAERFASRAAIAAPPAAGLMPPIRGLHTGLVKQVAQDPTNDFRVLVTLPLVGDETGVWARLPQFYASSGFGAVFYPEVGDEVVLGFMDEDPGSPIILGSLYSKARKPREETQPNDANDMKAIVTRDGAMRILFNDKDRILTVKTDGERIVVLDDKNKTVTISDPFKNSITMAEASVDIVSSKDLNLTSKANMTFDCGASLTVTAKAAYSLEAATIAEKSKGTLQVQANGPAEFKSSAVLVIQGALVKIN